MPRMPDAPLYGLVLIGGNSSRMGRDKALLEYHDAPEWQRVFVLLESFTEKAFVSLSDVQSKASEFSGASHIVDCWDSIGPMNGIASAMGEHPDAAWLVAACDMPGLDVSTIGRLKAARNSACMATVFVDEDERLEPLCAIYEPGVVEAMLESILREDYSLYRCLERLSIERVSLDDASALRNLNTPEESDKYRQHRVD